MTLDIRVNQPIDADAFVELLRASTLAERRPVDDRACVEGMLAHADLTVTAWLDGRLVGISRAVTDFHYACYVSELAVDLRVQRQGIGRALLRATQAQLGPRCTLLLFAAPAADRYYERIGMTRNPRGWMLRRDQSLADD